MRTTLAFVPFCTAVYYVAMVVSDTLSSLGNSVLFEESILQAYKGHAPQQKELGSQPQWTRNKR